MCKKIIISIVVTGVLWLGYYAISPLFKNVHVDDAFPENLIVDTKEVVSVVIPSGFEKLSEERQKDMLEEMKVVNETPMPRVADETPEGEKIDTVEETQFQVLGTAGHPADGFVQILKTSEGIVIRYEDFSTINGPRLHLYLAKDLDAQDFIDLGPIRGTKGNINYSIPKKVDIEEYHYVMYWCVPFGVLFNYAQIR